jgi:hypothetical protein
MIVNLKAILSSNDGPQTSTYKSRNNEFRRLPPKVQVTLPKFSPQKINTDQLRKMFGSLSSLSIIIKQYIITIEEAVSPPPVRPLLDKPRLIATIDTGYSPLYSVSCVDEDQFWICGLNKTKKLLNLQGKLQTTIQTKSGGWPGDIAVTRDG